MKGEKNEFKFEDGILCLPAGIKVGFEIQNWWIIADKDHRI